MADIETNGSLALHSKECRVIKIEADKERGTQKLRVAAYCRVSSSSEDQLNSFMAQSIHYTQCITANENWRLVDVYADAPVIIGLKQNPTQTGAALVLFSLFAGIFETFR